MNVVIIVQARLGSTRLPNKVMRSVCGTPLIGLQLDRLRGVKKANQIVLAIPDNTENAPLETYLIELGYPVFLGDEKDVLDRYYQAAKSVAADVIVRITGDCPLIDSELVDYVIENFIVSNVDYASNVAPPTYPDGLDVEVFTFNALKESWLHAVDVSDREHVTKFIRSKDQFSKLNVTHDEDYSSGRWTVDEREDLEVIEKVFEHFHPNIHFSWQEVIDLLKARPEYFAGNQTKKRNEGLEMLNGQKLWNRAKRVIPGGNMLLSKRSEMFLPDHWPTYFSKAKGCSVWDLDGRNYTDMSIMGVGTNILGYGHPEVDEAVMGAVTAGNMSTLNCPEEVYLAEKLIELHPWAEMVRFARTGGEANAISIRIARAASGRDKVAICGYHGWHDWYLAANLGDEENLDGHLLPGLDPKGVPKNLRGSVLPFAYNDYSALEALVRDNDIGVIKMEVSRNTGPEDGFLRKVRDLATKKGIVLVFDECTSGFRQTFGGLHKLYGVEPDVAIFGKALGNGYAITAILGRREVMESAQGTFISSTFWTERVGPVAALKTLEIMSRERSWEVITNTGDSIFRGWHTLAKKYDLSITTMGLPALASFSFNSDRALEYKTLITQEMLVKGYLAGTNIYASTEHTPVIIKDFFDQLDPVFALIRECEDGRDVMGLLNGPLCHSGFRRLN